MLSEKQKDVIRVAMANVDEANAVIAEIDKISAAGSVAAVASADADAVYGAEEQALLNECKAQINALIAALS